MADGELAPDLSMVELLSSVDPAVWTPTRVDLIRAWERVAGDGRRPRSSAALCAVADATEGRGLAEEEARHEVGAALRLSPSTAGERTWVATSLRRRLPGDAGGVGGRGHLPTCRPRTWSRRSASSTTTAASTVEARVLGRAPEQTVSEFKRSVARAVLAVDPASAADRHQKATAARTIERMPAAGRDGVVLGHHARRHQPATSGPP